MASGLSPKSGTDANIGHFVQQIAMFPLHFSNYFGCYPIFEIPPDAD
jgi:hypothetical protein